MECATIEISHEPTGETFRFRFEDMNMARDAMAVLNEYGVGTFLDKYSGFEEEPVESIHDRLMLTNATG